MRTQGLSTAAAANSSDPIGDPGASGVGASLLSSDTPVAIKGLMRGGRGVALLQVDQLAEGNLRKAYAGLIVVFVPIVVLHHVGIRRQGNHRQEHDHHTY